MYSERADKLKRSFPASPSPETLIAARKQLTGCSLQGVDMVSCADLPCDDRNLFTIAPMGPDPLDYFGSESESRVNLIITTSQNIELQARCGLATFRQEW
jgi:hypothetical protein